MQMIDSNQIKTVEESMNGRKDIYTMPEDVHKLTMDMYDVMVSIRHYPTYVFIVRELPQPLKQQVTIEEMRLNGVRAGQKKRIKLDEVPYA